MYLEVATNNQGLNYITLPLAFFNREEIIW